MMRLIFGSEKPKFGSADFGSSSVEANYFAQSQVYILFDVFSLSIIIFAIMNF